MSNRPDTIPARLIAQADARPSSAAYHVKVGGSWRTTNWRTYVEEMRTAARAMMSLGFEKGDKVAILGFNRPEWVIFNIAAMAAGGAAAGVYTTCSAEEVQYIVHHSEAKLMLLEDEGQWKKVNERRDELPLLKRVVMMKGAADIDDELVMSWEKFNALAEQTSDDKLDRMVDDLDPEALATLIYTSGTTGPPKGVMLSHANLAWTASCSIDLIDSNESDCSLSYLPLSHIAEQMITIHGPTTIGSSVYYAESIEKVADNLREVQPTIVFGVPRIWEKFHAAVSAKLADASGFKAKLVSWVRGVMTQKNNLENQGRTPGGLLKLQIAIANKLVISKLKPALGLSRARICVSGAAPIAAEILEFFASLDVVIREVYGQSEDNGPTTFNVPGKTKFGTVGARIPGVEVKIADDDEILVKGPNVFMGYYKDKAATDDCLIDGWLHSGDLGSFDSDGFLTITGRKKDIIITAGGKNIAPKNIESALKNNKYIDEAVVIGDRRKFLSALITLDPEAVDKFIADHHLDPDRGVHEHKELENEVQKAVDEVNTHLARVETIKKFKILPRNFTVEDGELTPTLKVKRKIVNEHFADEIESMYS